MNIRLYNARILTMEPGKEIFTGEMWVQGSEIIYIGDDFHKEEVFCKEEDNCIIWDREIDAKGNLIMPGFKNAHTHSGMTFLRSFADNLPLNEWLTKAVFPMEAKLTKEDVYLFTKLAIMEYVTSGITANCDMYLFPEEIAQAAIDTGFRTVQVGALNNFSQSVPLIEKYYRELNSKDSLSSYQLGFHAEYTTSTELLKDLASLSKKFKAPVYTHNSETKAEVDSCIERHGKTPTALFEELGLLEYGGAGFHCVYLSEEDKVIFKEKSLTVVTNPASNAKLASGIAPIYEMEKAGIQIAIGTDGPASNNALDMFREMYLTSVFSKLQRMDAKGIEETNILSMATTGGAKAMGLDQCDTLSVGKKADFILLDLQQPNMQPILNIPVNIVNSGSKQNVKMTVVNGKILYEDGEFYLGFEKEKLYEEIAVRVKSMINS